MRFDRGGAFGGFAFGQPRVREDALQRQRRFFDRRLARAAIEAGPALEPVAPFVHGWLHATSRWHSSRASPAGTSGGLQHRSEERRVGKENRTESTRNR